MKLFCQQFIILCLIALPFQRNLAQEFPASIPDSAGFEIELPPLSVLIDSACLHNANVRYRDLDIQVQQGNLNSDRTYWMRNLGVTTDVRYGSFDYLRNTASDGEIPINTLTSTNEFRYGFGAYLKFPLVDLVNKRNTQKIGRIEIEKAEQMAESERDAVREKVIRQYNDLILKMRLFKIRVKQVETARINLHMAEKEFLNGVIPVTEYTRLSDITIGVETSFESSRMDLVTSLMLLEHMTGMKLKIRKP